MFVHVCVCVYFCVGHGPKSADNRAQMDRFTLSGPLPPFPPSFSQPPVPGIGPHIRSQLESLKHIVLNYLVHWGPAWDAFLGPHLGLS